MLLSGRVPPLLVEGRALLVARLTIGRSAGKLNSKRTGRPGRFVLCVNTMDKVKLLSYAKVNLTLDVSRLRPDGYHDIDSVAQVIDISDELEMCRADAGVIEVIVEGGGAPSGKENLVYRACEVFFDETGIEGGARVVLRKRIPVQAGLGGGSGNAAAAIAGLGRLYEHRLSPDEMAAMAAMVGSDAALFIHGGTVRMSGRGDDVTLLPDVPEMHLVVIKPDVGVSTAWAYAELDKREQRVLWESSSSAEDAIRAGDRAAILAWLANDFDPMVSALVPEIFEAKQGLVDAGAQAVLLAGSGSAVFGVYGDQEAAQSGAARLAGEFAQAFACRTLTRAESTLV